MAAMAFLVAMAFLACCNSAEDTTGYFHMPDGMFYPSPTPVTFVGQSRVSGTVTFVTIDCDSTGNFWPGPYGCDSNDNYKFSAFPTYNQFEVPT